MTVFRFVEREKAHHPVRTMCRLLGVSASGYWAWRGRDPSPRALSDADLVAQIREAHRVSRGTYGAPRVHAELRASGVRCGRKRVARLMRREGLAGVHRRRFVRTAVGDQTAVRAPDLVERRFERAAPDRLWVADITYLPTRAGFLYLAAIVDAWSRLVVGWAMAAHLRATLVSAALAMAVARRQPDAGLVHHSDHGTQYSSLAFGRRLAEAGIAASMGSRGDAYDNASPRASSPASRRSSSTAATGARRTKPTARSSNTSGSSTTSSDATQRWATCRRPSSRGGIVRRRSRPNRLSTKAGQLQVASAS